MKKHNNDGLGIYEMISFLIGFLLFLLIITYLAHKIGFF